MPVLAGTLKLNALPPHLGAIVHLCFFAVKDAESPAPYNGDPPTEAAKDLEQILHDVHPKTESHATSIEQNFRVERAEGYYFVQVRVILFQNHNSKLFAQSENFFFAKRPIYFNPASEQPVTFPVTWPDIPLKDLHSYGTIKPRPKRTWWRFWGD